MRERSKMYGRKEEPKPAPVPPPDIKEATKTIINRLIDLEKRLSALETKLKEKANG